MDNYVQKSNSLRASLKYLGVAQKLGCRFDWPCNEAKVEWPPTCSNFDFRPLRLRMGKYYAGEADNVCLENVQKVVDV